MTVGWARKLSHSSRERVPVPGWLKLVDFGHCPPDLSTFHLVTDHMTDSSPPSFNLWIKLCLKPLLLAPHLEDSSISAKG